MAKARDYSKVAPQKLSELNKESMLKFCISKGKEDLSWFNDLCLNNRKEKINNITKEQINGFDDNAIRKAFAKKYFPNLVDKKKTKKTIPTFEEQLKQAMEQAK